MNESSEIDDERELVRSFLEERTESAFRGIYRSHTPVLFRVALRLLAGQVADAEDVVHQAGVSLDSTAVMKVTPELLAQLKPETGLAPPMPLGGADEDEEDGMSGATAVMKLTPELLESDLEYKNSKGLEFANPLWHVVSHIFNHQTHHRGQVTALLSQSGIDPGITDFMITAMMDGNPKMNWPTTVTLLVMPMSAASACSQPAQQSQEKKCRGGNENRQAGARCSPGHHQWKRCSYGKSGCRKKCRLNRLSSRAFRNPDFVSSVCTQRIMSHQFFGDYDCQLGLEPPALIYFRKFVLFRIIVLLERLLLDHQVGFFGIGL